MPPNVVETRCAALAVERGSSHRSRRSWLSGAAPLPLIAVGITAILVVERAHVPVPPGPGFVASTCPGTARPVSGVTSPDSGAGTVGPDRNNPATDQAPLGTPADAASDADAADAATGSADTPADARSSPSAVTDQRHDVPAEQPDAGAADVARPAPRPFAVTDAIARAAPTTGAGEVASAGRLPGDHSIWFTPDAGSPDMLALFDAPELWPAARSHVSVFKFYQGQVLDPPPAIVENNTYASLRAVDAFRKLTGEWHKQIAIEVPAVKPFYCHPSGMHEPIGNTVKAVSNVVAAGGRVDLLAMDEPFASGLTAPECGGPDVTPTAIRVERYVKVVRLYLPGLLIGDVEPYPMLTGSQIEAAISAMRERGVQPAFLHLDVDLNALQSDERYADYDVAGDLKRLKAVCGELGIRFGVIFWGRDTSLDAVYYADALRRVQLVKRTFGSWNSMPDDLVFQSFAVSGDGQMSVPSNLPESELITHTGLIERALLMLAGVGRS